MDFRKFSWGGNGKMKITVYRVLVPVPFPVRVLSFIFSKFQKSEFFVPKVFRFYLCSVCSSILQTSFFSAVDFYFVLRYQIFMKK